MSVATFVNAGAFAPIESPDENSLEDSAELAQRILEEVRADQTPGVEARRKTCAGYKFTGDVHYLLSDELKELAAAEHLCWQVDLDLFSLALFDFDQELARVQAARRNAAAARAAELSRRT